MKHHLAFLAAFAALAVSVSAQAEEPILLAQNEIGFGLVDPKDAMAGEVAVLSGDPSKPGPFAVRLRFKAGSMVKTHSHSTAEYVTILSGKGRMSFGNAPDEANAKEIAAGSFLYLPAGKTHTLWIDEESVADLYSTGPFDETFVQN